MKIFRLRYLPSIPGIVAYPGAGAQAISPVLLALRPVPRLQPALRSRGNHRLCRDFRAADRKRQGLTVQRHLQSVVHCFLRRKREPELERLLATRWVSECVFALETHSVGTEPQQTLLPVIHVEICADFAGVEWHSLGAFLLLFPCHPFSIFLHDNLAGLLPGIFDLRWALLLRS